MGCASGSGWRAGGLVAALMAALMAYALAAGADKSAREVEIEAEIVAQVEAVSPEAALAFVEASAARDRSDLGAAVRGFTRAHELAPGVAAPLRRLCGVKLQQKDRSAALEHCRAAVALEESAYNLGALAVALGTDGSPEELTQAHNLAKRAVRLTPDDVSTTITLAQTALAVGDAQDVRFATKTLRRIAPELGFTSYLSALDAATRGEWQEADEMLDRASTQGMPADDVEGLRSRIREAQPWTARTLPIALRVGACWLAGGALLFLFGLLLSRATLRVANQLPTQATGSAHGSSAALRRAYAGLLWATCAFYYLSIPVVTVTTLLIGGALMYAAFALGYVPIKLAALVALGVIATVWALLKSLFVRVKETDPGKALDLTEHPRLAAALREVAEKVDTRPVDRVFLTPGTDVAVFERGGMMRQLRGTPSERCLLLGLAVLHGMRLDDFKAILAHEYGHFRNQDTAGGGFALAVRRSIVHSALVMARAGAVAWYNPGWWFVRGFHLLFVRISHGASRLQEILADRWAALSYGADAFERGLKHVIARTVSFDLQANATLEEVIRTRSPLTNLYTYEPQARPSAEEVDAAVHEALEREPSPYDSHPAPLERIALVKRLQGADAPEPDETAALTLFEESERVEREMTAVLRAEIADTHGVNIPA